MPSGKPWTSSSSSSMRGARRHVRIPARPGAGGARPRAAANPALRASSTGCAAARGRRGPGTESESPTTGTWPTHCPSPSAPRLVPRRRRPRSRRLPMPSSLRLAIELWPSVPDAADRAGFDHPRLLVHAADAASSGRGADARSRPRDQAAAELAGRDPARSSRRSTARCTALAPRRRRCAEAQARRGIAGAGPVAAPGLRSQLLSDLVYVPWDARCYFDAFRTATRAVLLADTSGDRVQRARSRIGLALVLGEVGRHGAAHDLGEKRSRLSTTVLPTCASTPASP